MDSGAAVIALAILCVFVIVVLAFDDMWCGIGFASWAATATEPASAAIKTFIARIDSSLVVIFRGWHDRDAVRIGNAERNGGPRRCQRTEGIVGEERQVGLARAVIDHSENAVVCIDVRRRAVRDVGRRETIDEDVVSGTNQTADRLAASVRSENVFADACHPARRSLACGNDGRECAITKQAVL